MRTNVDIDDTLMNEALRSGAFATKREAVEAGLRLLAQRGRYRELLALRGKLEWDDSVAVATHQFPHSHSVQQTRAAYQTSKAAPAAPASKRAKSRK